MNKTAYCKAAAAVLAVTLLVGCNINNHKNTAKNKLGNLTAVKMVEGKMTKVNYTKTIKDPAALFEGIKLAPSYKPMGNHNPIMTQRFGADPFAMVYGDRVYVYTTHDSIEKDADGTVKQNTYSKIRTLNCVSSDDLVNWTDHGIIKVGGEQGVSRWASNSWAPAAAHKTIDGKEKFFIYYANSANSIGVLSSDSPVGPFIDPIQKPLITKQTPNCADVVWCFDPAVLVDDDGKAYLYFGGGIPTGKEEMPNTARAVELGKDMISLAGTPVVIEAPYLFEDSGINKIGDTYYYSYCSNFAKRENATGKYVPEAGTIIYMTSKNPLGPWNYQGPILRNPGVFFGSYGNNHHSLIKFKNKWYMFYHTQLLQDTMGIKGGYRSSHVDEVKINEDGSISQITATRAGAGQVKPLNPYQIVEAETIACMGGVSTVECSEKSEAFGPVNMAVSASAGSYIGVSNVDFGKEGCKTFTAKVSSESAGSVIKICVDNLNEKAIGYLEVPNTESKDTYASVTVDVEAVTGVHNLYFVFAGTNCQVDSWSFQK